MRRWHDNEGNDDRNALFSLRMKRQRADSRSFLFIIFGASMLFTLWTIWVFGLDSGAIGGPPVKTVVNRKLQGEQICTDVDVVFTWVNGSDPEHRAKMKEYGYKWDGGYRDYGTLRYALRSVDQFMPWARNIIIVTNGQVPSWLNTSAPRLRLVTHNTIFHDPEVLPTFNSNAIEANLGHIPDLAPCLLFLNDDMLFARDINIETFFDSHGNLKVDISHSFVAPERLHSLRNLWHSSVTYSNDLLQSYYYSSSGTLVRHPYTSHACYAMRSDILSAVEKHWPDETIKTSSHKFRQEDDLAIPFLQMNVALEEFGASVATDEHGESRTMYSVWTPDHNKNVRAWNSLWSKPHVCICINDRLDNSAASQREIDFLIEMLDTRYPHPSSFELVNN